MRKWRSSGRRCASGGSSRGRSRGRIGPWCCRGSRRIGASSWGASQSAIHSCEQLGRAQAAAERRVERRQGLGGRLGKKLVEQARALRDRIGQELSRVKEWVLERFPEPFKQIRERTRELFGAADPTLAAAKAAGPLDLAALKAQGRAASAGWRETLHQTQAAERRAAEAREVQERQRQLEAERVQRERQALAERQARERAARERTVEQFRELAVRREMKGSGFGDRSEKWRETPEGLREIIDRFNTLAPEARQRHLDRLLQEPTRGREVELLQQLIDQRRERVKALGHGRGL